MALSPSLAEDSDPNFRRCPTQKFRARSKRVLQTSPPAIRPRRDSPRAYTAFENRGCPCLCAIAALRLLATQEQKPSEKDSSTRRGMARFQRPRRNCDPGGSPLTWTVRPRRPRPSGPPCRSTVPPPRGENESASRTSPAAASRNRRIDSRPSRSPPCRHSPASLCAVPAIHGEVRTCERQMRWQPLVRRARMLELGSSAGVTGFEPPPPRRSSVPCPPASPSWVIGAVRFCSPERQPSAVLAGERSHEG
jgi:hypothetical protein